MDSNLAQRVIESLRKGIPPDGFVRYFTVGRINEINDLKIRLNDKITNVLLIKANYGSGKTHLLKYIREEALEKNFAVSFVTIDSYSGVKFNRMDQILGAICRNIEIPGIEGKGIGNFFNLITKCIINQKNEIIWKKISDNGRWGYSDVLKSQAVFIALRAWQTEIKKVLDLIDDWFKNPWVYKVQRKKLYTELVLNLNSFFRDPRPEWKFYADNVFVFSTNGYEQCWQALDDFNLLAQAAGLKGFIILFDEFEDVITNMKNIAHQESALWNLFDFYAGKKFSGKTFYAVTPDFVEKCKRLLYMKGRTDFGLDRFNQLPTYEMSPLDISNLEELANKILHVHGIAYEWEPDLVMKAKDLLKIVKEAATINSPDRSRYVITSIIRYLDEIYQNHHER